MDRPRKVAAVLLFGVILFIALGGPSLVAVPHAQIVLHNDDTTTHTVDVRIVRNENVVIQETISLGPRESVEVTADPLTKTGTYEISVRFGDGSVAHESVSLPLDNAGRDSSLIVQITGKGEIDVFARVKR